MTTEITIAKCDVSGAAGAPDYRQAVRCGRHELVADERPHEGGADAGPTPFEYLLTALGSCTSITLRMYARRKGWDLGAVEVALSLRQADKDRHIERRISCSGTLTEEQRGRLLEICEKTPVTLAVKSGLALSTTLNRP